MGKPYVRFEPNPRIIIAWRAHLLGRHANDNDPNPGDHYARALLAFQALLVNPALWREDRTSPGMFKFVGVTPDHKLAFPEELSEFSNDEHWAMFKGIFENLLLFRPYLHPEQGLILEVTDDLSATAANIFYLLQLLVPGMLLIVHEIFIFVNMAYHGNGSSTLPQEVRIRRIHRAMPPAQWILNNAQVLGNIFGQEYVQAFRECAVNRSHGDWTTYTRNWVRISVLHVDGIDTDANTWPVPQMPISILSRSNSKTTLM